jgi:N-acetylneuraminic acid mutarotase
MRKKRTAQSGLFGLRPLVSILVCAAAICSMIITGTLLAFVRFEAPAKIPQRMLTLAERVAYQRAIEEVYWHHRIWPKSNANAKPPLDKVMSQAEIEKKVEDYLRDSQALEDYWQRPITPGQLQAEMERIASQTKQPEVLRGIFAALGNDSLVIAECLARPVLTERLAGDLSSPDNKVRVDSARSKRLRSVSMETTVANSAYTLPRIAEGNASCTDDSWAPTCVTNAPDGRVYHSAVWTGTEMIVWGGENYPFVLNTGGRYNPSTDSWTATSTTSAPSRRYKHTAVWTGTEMIVWGGTDFESDLDTGGQYNPGTDTWTPTATRINLPSGREGHTAVWTGSQMIIWGGAYHGVGPPVYFNTGGRYDPSTNSWTATSTPSAPSGREFHTAVWTVNEMIIWGGESFGSYLNTGGRYNPTTDTWAATSTSNAPSPRSLHTGVWTATEMIVWGGSNSGGYLNTGGRYNPGTDTWTATSTINTPSARQFHASVWCGSEMIIWGGGFPVLNTGGRYNPAADNWAATSTTSAPIGRALHTAVWTGSEMIVWGGEDDTQIFNTGGRYGSTPAAMCPPTPTAIPTITPRRPIPTPRPRPTHPPPPPRP